MQKATEKAKTLIESKRQQSIELDSTFLQREGKEERGREREREKNKKEIKEVE